MSRHKKGEGGLKGAWREQQRIQALMQRASTISKANSRPAVLNQFLSPVFQSLNSPFVVNALSGQASILPGVLAHLKKLVALDGHQAINSSILHWLLFFAWNPVRELFGGVPDDFTVDAQWQLSTDKYAAVVLALGWEEYLAEALRWLPKPETQAPQLLSLLEDSCPDLTASLSAALPYSLEGCAPSTPLPPFGSAMGLGQGSWDSWAPLLEWPPPKPPSNGSPKSTLHNLATDLTPGPASGPGAGADAGADVFSRRSGDCRTDFLACQAVVRALPGKPDWISPPGGGTAAAAGVAEPSPARAEGNVLGAVAASPRAHSSSPGDSGTPPLSSPGGQPPGSELVAAAPGSSGAAAASVRAHFPGPGDLGIAGARAPDDRMAALLQSAGPEIHSPLRMAVIFLRMLQHALVQGKITPSTPPHPFTPPVSRSPFPDPPPVPPLEHQPEPLEGSGPPPLGVVSCRGGRGLLGSAVDLAHLAADAVSGVADLGLQQGLLGAVLEGEEWAGLRDRLSDWQELQEVAARGLVAVSNRMIAEGEADVFVFDDEATLVATIVRELLPYAVLAPEATIRRLLLDAVYHKGQAKLVAEVLRALPALAHYHAPAAISETQPSSSSTLLACLTHVILGASPSPFVPSRPPPPAATVLGVARALISPPAPLVTPEELLRGPICHLICLAGGDPSADPPGNPTGYPSEGGLGPEGGSGPEGWASSRLPKLPLETALRLAGLVLGEGLEFWGSGRTPLGGPASGGLESRRAAAGAALARCGAGGIIPALCRLVRRGAFGGTNILGGFNGGAAWPALGISDGLEILGSANILEVGLAPEVEQFPVPYGCVRLALGALRLAAEAFAAACAAERAGQSQLLAVKVKGVPPPAAPAAAGEVCEAARAILSGAEKLPWSCRLHLIPLAAAAGGFEAGEAVLAGQKGEAGQGVKSAGSGFQLFAPQSLADLDGRQYRWVLSTAAKVSAESTGKILLGAAPVSFGESSFSAEGPLQDALVFCSISDAAAGAFASACRAVAAALSGRPKNRLTIPPADSDPIPDRLTRQVAALLAASTVPIPAESLRKALPGVCSQLLPYMTPLEFQRVARIALPAVIKPAEGQAPSSVGVEGHSLEAIAVSGAVLEVLSQAVCLSAASVKGEEEAAIQSLLQQLAGHCRWVTAAAGEPKGLAAQLVGRRCLHAICALADSVQDSVDCSCLEAVLLFLVQRICQCSRPVEAQELQTPRVESEAVPGSPSESVKAAESIALAARLETLDGIPYPKLISWVEGQLAKIHSEGLEGTLRYAVEKSVDDQVSSLA